MHVILLSGVTDHALLEAAQLLDVDAVLAKPVSRAQPHRSLDQVPSPPMNWPGRRDWQRKINKRLKNGALDPCNHPLP